MPGGPGRENAVEDKPDIKNNRDRHGKLPEIIPPVFQGGPEQKSEGQGQVKGVENSEVIGQERMGEPLDPDRRLDSEDGLVDPIKDVIDGIRPDQGGVIAQGFINPDQDHEGYPIAGDREGIQPDYFSFSRVAFQKFGRPVKKINQFDGEKTPEGVEDRTLDQMEVVAVNKSQGAQERGENQQDDQVRLEENKDPTQGVVFPQRVHGIFGGVTWIENRSGTGGGFSEQGSD